jgi:hypothetical protein
MPLNPILIHPAALRYAKTKLAILGIPPVRLLQSTIHAKELIVSLLGGCGAPHLFQIKALQSTIQSHLKLQYPNPTLSEDQNLNNPNQKLIILIERTKFRWLRNAPRLRQVITAYDNRNNYKIHLHNDANLPPLAEQLQLFAKADIAVGPHGGTSIFGIGNARG